MSHPIMHSPKSSPAARNSDFGPTATPCMMCEGGHEQGQAQTGTSAGTNNGGHE